MGTPHDRFENGFYYDFDLPRPLTPDDFPEIEGRMRRIVREEVLKMKPGLERRGQERARTDAVNRIQAAGT